MAPKNKTSDPPTNPLDELRKNLRALGFVTTDAIESILEQAQKLNQGFGAFLSDVTEAELAARRDATIEKLLKAASLNPRMTFDSFDFLFQEGLNVRLVKDLMNLDFVPQARPVLSFGKPGTGKTHLANGYGHLAVRAGMTVHLVKFRDLLPGLSAALKTNSAERKIRTLARFDLLIIDDLRRIPPKPEYASLFCDVIEARYQKKATILSSNLNVAQFGEVLGDAALVACTVDRLMERAHIINIKDGRSYRSEGPDAPPDQDRPVELQRTKAA
jgi:DNA replication protein DnaC